MILGYDVHQTDDLMKSSVDEQMLESISTFALIEIKI